MGRNDVVKHPSERIAELMEEVADLKDRIEALETSVSTWASLARGAEVERDRLKERIRKAQVVLHE